MLFSHVLIEYAHVTGRQMLYKCANELVGDPRGPKWAVKYWVISEGQETRVGNYATAWMDSWRITQQILYDFRNKFLTSSPRNSIIALFDAWRSSQM